MSNQDKQLRDYFDVSGAYRRAGSPPIDVTWRIVNRRAAFRRRVLAIGAAVVMGGMGQ